MLSPLPRHSAWWNCLAHPFSRISLPRKGYRVGLCIVFFEACSVFTHVTACTLAPVTVNRDPHYQRLQPFRYLHSCSSCFRLELSPGGIHTHWKTPPYHGAHPFETVNFLKAVLKFVKMYLKCVKSSAYYYSFDLLFSNSNRLSASTACILAVGCAIPFTQSLSNLLSELLIVTMD